MRILISNELLKLRTSRVPFALLAATVLLIVLGMSGIVAAGTDISKPGGARLLLAHAGLSSLFVLVLGIYAVAGEYRDGTIAETFLVSPRRGRVIAAKLVAYTGVGFAFGIVAAVVALATGAFWFGVKGLAFDPSSEDVWRTLLGVVGWQTAYAALGVGLGAAVRSLAGSITVALAWIALVEGVMANLLGGFDRWLPMSSALALGNAPGTKEMLSQPVAAVVLAAYAALFAVAGAVLTARRDIGEAA